MVILLRAIVWATLFVAFGLVMLPSWLLRDTGVAVRPATGLVVEGPFLYSRNPIYVGAVAAMTGAALYFESWGLLAYAVAITFHILVRAYEEPVLRGMFGAAYDAYCARVPRWPTRLSRRIP
jgi:protein-S-isoprenylcysteine O-methyltransferase Ste14